MSHQELIARLAHPNENRMVLLVIDGVGDLRTAHQPQTALEAAELPNLDALAKRSALGRVQPVATGITPGSGPGHLALLGYDPTSGEADIGRGVLEVLGLGLEVRPGEVAARGNFATADADGNLTDRRAGRIPTSECRRLCDKLSQGLANYDAVETQIDPGEEHRFVMVLRGDALSAAISDTDPQQTGVPPLAPQPLRDEAARTAGYIAEILALMNAAIEDEPQANRVLLRGFSTLPHLPKLTDLYQIRAGAFAGYPLYRGVAATCGMEVVPCGKEFAEIVATVRNHWDRFDFFFLHVKQTDKAGEDGNLAKKIEVLQHLDATLPRLLELEPTVLAITGDHSTPAPLASHSWHPVPLLIHAPFCFADPCSEYTETAAVAGHLGTIPSQELMGLILANAGRLAKFGA